jgi:multidrug efflux pump subunit AcrB
VLEYRYLFTGIVISIFILSIGMLAGGVLKFQAFPDLEGDFVEARILLPQGTSLQETQKVIDTLLTQAANIDQKYKEKYGKTLIKNRAIYYNKNLDSYEKGKHIATISLELLTSNDRKIQMNDFIFKWKSIASDIPNVILISFKEPALPVGGLPIEIKLFSNDLKALQNSSVELKDWIEKYEGIFYVSTDLRKGKKEYNINLKEGTLPLGITSKMVAHELRGALYGGEVNEFQLEKENIEVNVQFDDNKKLEDLKKLRIKGIPLSEIIDIEETKSYSRINRIDKKRVVTVQGEIDSRITNANEILSHTQEKFFPILKKKYPNVHIKIYGQAKETKKTAKSFVSSFVIGLFLIFLLLSLQFKSYLEPLIAISIIPLAFIGVIWGHLLMGINLAMPSMIGFVSLGGIVINNSILLVLFLKANKDKMGLDQALIQASKDRFRAIALTSITTIAGLIPILLETSLQAQILIPLIVSITFGLLLSTVLVLYVVPVLYKIINDFTSEYKGKNK